MGKQSKGNWAWLQSPCCLIWETDKKKTEAPKKKVEQPKKKAEESKKSASEEIDDIFSKKKISDTSEIDDIFNKKSVDKKKKKTEEEEEEEEQEQEELSEEQANKVQEVVFAELAAIKKTKNPKKRPAPTDDGDEFGDSRGIKKTSRYTDDGYPLYDVKDLNIGNGLDTPECPFDCQCCKLLFTFIFSLYF